jgi:hypothetical protein
MRQNKQKKYPWTKFKDEDLLDIRFCDLKLDINNTGLQQHIHRLYNELEQRHIKFKPHCWLSEEWFSPDGVPGIALPFYLAHPRLTKLEFRQMYDVEGGTLKHCMQLLRHETGHAINTAYKLHFKKRWKQIFGPYTKRHPVCYTPDPESRRYVMHLDWWYAQSHPAEDFAQT